MTRPRSTFTYLRRHYFDDDKLRDLALREFKRALRSSRLVAFTGSFTTAIFNYPTWSALVSNAMKFAEEEAGKIGGKPRLKMDPVKLIDTFRRMIGRDPTFDGRVAFSAVAQMLDHLDPREMASNEATEKIADLFRQAQERLPVSNPSPVACIFDELQIDRVVTTNYDFELETHAMQLRVRPGPDGTRKPASEIERLVEEDEVRKIGKRLVRALPNAERVVSDVLEREGPEGLIEFAIGCPEIDKHIFHLHGRADHPDGMIVSYRDYDRLYRRRGLGKAPFEHALRILFAGNPVLFVGLGMTEPELNATLQEFVGNHPYLRKAPSFLLWNEPEEWRALKKAEHDGSFYADEEYPCVTASERRTAFRLDKLHRLGILTLFADDLPPLDVDPGPLPSSRREQGLELLRRSLLRLAALGTEGHRQRTRKIPDTRWRNYLPRIRSGMQGKSRVMEPWRIDWPNPSGATGAEDASVMEESSRVTVLVRSPGDSNTARARAIAQAWTKRKPERRAFIINFNLRIDTDSILAMIATLLRYDPATDKEASHLLHISREKLFSPNQPCCRLQSGGELLIVLRSLERIFDVNGHPLSAEFDQFLRALIVREEGTGIRFAVIGTDRIRAYFEGLRRHLETTERAKGAIIFAEKEATSFEPAYLAFLRDRFKTSGIVDIEYRNRSARDYGMQRRSVYRAVLTSVRLTAAGFSPEQADLALDILLIMSLIGQPVEAAVLFHAPRIQKRLTGEADDRRTTLWNVLAKLEEVRLIGQIRSQHDRAPAQRRFAVHLSLQTEIRDRNGIPLSDSILSTAYNMSLFSAQPADGALPEVDLHDELGQLVDWLVGAYRDDPLDGKAPVRDRGAPHVVSAYRAAFALVRGLYSTSALLSVDRDDRLVSEEHDGLLTEHAERLDRLLEAFSGIIVKRGDSDLPPPEPLLPDELVWLHNERGVVKLAQGDLYEARFSFDEAERINRDHVEFGQKSHNWRRITLNQIVVDIERGRLQNAEDRMNAVERGLGHEKLEHIRGEYLGNSSSQRRIRFDAIVRHEDILAMALITGYRGLTSHLRGELDAARVHFERSIRVLQRMDEQRALALIRRHKASLCADLGDLDGLQRETRLVIAGAESVRQLDIVYTGQLLEAARLDQSSDPSEKKRGMRLALEALEYATLADLHRLTIHAQSRLAWAKYHNGDYEAALEHTTEAITLATRHGLSLYKVSLRTLMGLILIKRGTREPGTALIRSSINGAVRIGYQRAVEGARRALADTAT